MSSQSCTQIAENTSCTQIAENTSCTQIAENNFTLLTFSSC